MFLWWDFQGPQFILTFVVKVILLQHDERRLHRLNIAKFSHEIVAWKWIDWSEKTQAYSCVLKTQQPKNLYFRLSDFDVWVSWTCLFYRLRIINRILCRAFFILRCLNQTGWARFFVLFRRAFHRCEWDTSTCTHFTRTCRILMCLSFKSQFKSSDVTVFHDFVVVCVFFSSVVFFFSSTFRVTESQWAIMRSEYFRLDLSFLVKWIFDILCDRRHFKGIYAQRT